MALLLNNMAQPNSGGTQTSTPATNPNGYVTPGTPNQSVPSLSARIRTALGNIGQAILPSATYKPYSAPVTGLLSPSHPSVGSLNTGTPVASHTVTTNPDNSVTSKVTYANDANTAPTTANTNTITPAPTAPLAQSAFQVDPNSGPGLTGGNYGNGTGAQQNPIPTQSSSSGISFPGIESSLVNSSLSGSANATNAATGLLNAPAQNAALGTNGQGIGNEYATEIQKAIAPYIGLAAGQSTTGTAPVAQGNEMATLAAANQLGTQLANAGNLALSGNTQALTAQDQGQSGLMNAGSVANTQQTNVQSGLAAAATATAPQTTTPGQAVFNPATESYTAANSTGSPGTAPAGYDQGVWSQYMQDLSTGNISAIPTAVQGNPAVFGQLQEAVQQQNPGFNYNTAVGQGQGQQAIGAASGQAQASNIQTAGTAQTNALQAVYGQNAPAAYTLNTALNNIQSLGSLTLQTAQGGNINPLSTQVGNQTIGQFRNGLGSASQAAFNSNMSAFASSLSALYADQSGATPTQVSSWATQIANGSMPMQQLQAIYGASLSEGNLRLANLKSTASSAYSAEQGSAGGSTGGWGSLGD